MQTLFYWSIFSFTLAIIIHFRTYSRNWIKLEKFDFINLSNMFGMLLEEVLLRIPLLYLSKHFEFDIKYSALIFSLSHSLNYSSSRIMMRIYKIILLVNQLITTFYFFIFLSEYNIFLGMLIHYIYNIGMMLLFHLVGKLYIRYF